MNVKIVNKSKNQTPQYSTVHSAGLDIRANLDNSVIVKPGERVLIPTGLFIELPDGYEAQIRPRSGNAINYGITVLNTPGTIDPDYRGEIKVILINHSNIDFTINNGDRVGQIVISRFERVNWIEVDKLEESTRGDGGFGHTGLK